jgi:hypothetical protein
MALFFLVPRIWLAAILHRYRAADNDSIMLGGAEA